MPPLSPVAEPSSETNTDTIIDASMNYSVENLHCVVANLDGEHETPAESSRYDGDKADDSLNTRQNGQFISSSPTSSMAPLQEEDESQIDNPKQQVSISEESSPGAQHIESSRTEKLEPKTPREIELEARLTKLEGTLSEVLEALRCTKSLQEEYSSSMFSNDKDALLVRRTRSTHSLKCRFVPTSDLDESSDDDDYFHSASNRSTHPSELYIGPTNESNYLLGKPDSPPPSLPRKSRRKKGSNSINTLHRRRDSRSAGSSGSSMSKKKKGMSQDEISDEVVFASPGARIPFNHKLNPSFEKENFPSLPETNFDPQDLSADQAVMTGPSKRVDSDELIIPASPSNVSTEERDYADSPPTPPPSVEYRAFSDAQVEELRRRSNSIMSASDTERASRSRATTSATPLPLPSREPSYSNNPSFDNSTDSAAFAKELLNEPKSPSVAQRAATVAWENQQSFANQQIRQRKNRVEQPASSEILLGLMLREANDITNRTDLGLPDKSATIQDKNNAFRMRPREKNHQTIHQSAKSPIQVAGSVIDDSPISPSAILNGKLSFESLKSKNEPASTYPPGIPRPSSRKPPSRTTSNTSTDNAATQASTQLLRGEESKPLLPQDQTANAATSPGVKPLKPLTDVIGYVKLEMLGDKDEGSPEKHCDRNMEEFLRVPSRLERLQSFGMIVCLDCYLNVLTILPLKFILGLICLFWTGFKRKSNSKLVFSRKYLYKMLQSLNALSIYWVLYQISVGKLYHWVRGQTMMKLYLVIAIVEVFDRLMCSFGHDALDSMYWNTTRRPYHKRMVLSYVIASVYVLLHSLVLMVHVSTLNVAMNSADSALISLLIGGNFAEIKSTVFKKYNKKNLFQIAMSDICERFKLYLFMFLIMLLNFFQGSNTYKAMKSFLQMGILVIASETVADWIKHSFIAKFNFIPSNVYDDYALIIAGDVTGIGHEGVNIDQTHAVVKRVGLAQLPLLCVTMRYLTEALRYSYITYDDAGTIFFTCLVSFAVLLLVKVVTAMILRNVAERTLVYASRVKAPISEIRKDSQGKPLRKVV